MLESIVELLACLFLTALTLLISSCIVGSVVAALRSCGTVSYVERVSASGRRSLRHTGRHNRGGDVGGFPTPTRIGDENLPREVVVMTTKQPHCPPPSLYAALPRRSPEPEAS